MNQQHEMFSATKSQSHTRTIDQGLRSYMLKVYNYMAIGLGITALAAFLILNTPLYNAFFITNAMGQLVGLTGLANLVMWSPLIMVFALMFMGQRMSAGTAQALFWSYAATIGLSLAIVLQVYTSASAVRMFLITAGTFAGMSLYGYTTKKDLTSFGSFLIMGVWGLLIAMIVNIFMQSSMMSFIISILAVGIFTGLTAYDTQKIKQIYLLTQHAPDTHKKSAIFAALNLYIDFVMIFFHLMSLFGERR